jgi:hypothetical protein
MPVVGVVDTAVGNRFLRSFPHPFAAGWITSLYVQAPFTSALSIQISRKILSVIARHFHCLAYQSQCYGDDNTRRCPQAKRGTPQSPKTRTVMRASLILDAINLDGNGAVLLYLPQWLIPTLPEDLSVSDHHLRLFRRVRWK